MIPIELSIKWLNDNQGLVSAIIFFLTIGYGWLSGTFTALRRKPKLKIETIDGPTFSSTFSTGEVFNNYVVHRTVFALYLNVTNIGSASTSLKEIHIGYKWNVKPFGIYWWKYRLGWFWLRQQTVSLADFQVKIGSNVKFYPFLTQRSAISGDNVSSFLEVGRSSNGVVYFEQQDSYGACFPAVRKGKIAILVKAIDSFGKSHLSRKLIPSLTLEEASKYNPQLGFTLSSLREKGKLPQNEPEYTI